MRRAWCAEALGSMTLAAAVIGSGIMAERLANGNLAVALLANTFASIAALGSIIALLGPVSGAHFNPAVSLVVRLRGGLSNRDTAIYIVAQVLGCCLGAVLANAMFELPLIQVSTHARSGFGQWLSESVATAGLVLVVLGASTIREAAWRVPAWIGAAYWFTASTSFANPAITIARAMSDTFAGIALRDVPKFVAAQAAGAALGMVCARLLGVPRLKPDKAAARDVA